MILKSPGRTNYGVDRPDVMLVLLGAGCLLLFLGLIFSSPISATLLYGGLLAFVLLAVFAIMNALKPRAARELLNSLAWQGNERVLDIGCGRGLWLIAAAKHLTAGKAIGIDIWNRRLQSGNSPQATLENARLEGVVDKVEVREGRAQSLQFEDQSFDVVISSYVIHHVPKAEQRNALGEMVRVLKAGGWLAMLEVDDQAKAYAKVFRELGMVEVRTAWSKTLFFAIQRKLVAKKPSR